MSHVIDTIARLYSDTNPTPTTTALYQELALANRLIHRKLNGAGFTIDPSHDPDRFTSADQLRRFVSSCRLVPTYIGDSEHPLLSQEDNIRFRFVHDILAHTTSNDADFSFRGECAAFRNQSHFYPARLHPVLFTEIVGQAAYYFAAGSNFPPQRALLLPPSLLPSNLLS